jgi:predicted protein tyrosine phosphatase
MVQVIVLSRDFAQHFKYDKPWAAISIATYPKEFITLSTENRVGLLQIAFFDVDRPLSQSSEDALKGVDSSLFNKDHAQKILNFAKSVWNKIDLMLIHCEAGVSRSPAVAAALSVIFKGSGSDSEFFKQHIPNRLVYRTLLNTHYGVDDPVGAPPEPSEEEMKTWVNFF